MKVPLVRASPVRSPSHSSVQRPRRHRGRRWPGRSARRLTAGAPGLGRRAARRSAESPGEPVHCTGVFRGGGLRRLRHPARPGAQHLVARTVPLAVGATVGYTTPGVSKRWSIDRRQFDDDFTSTRLRGALMVSGARVSDVILQRGRRPSRSRPHASCTRLRSRLGANSCLQRPDRTGVAVSSSVGAGGWPRRRSTPSRCTSAIGSPGGLAWIVPVSRREPPYERIGLMCDGNAGQYFSRWSSRSRTWGIAGLPGLARRPAATSRCCRWHRCAASDPHPRNRRRRRPRQGDNRWRHLLQPRQRRDRTGRCSRRGCRVTRRGRRRSPSTSACGGERLGPELKHSSRCGCCQPLPDEEINALFELARTDGSCRSSDAPHVSTSTAI